MPTLKAPQIAFEVLIFNTLKPKSNVPSTISQTLRETSKNFTAKVFSIFFLMTLFFSVNVNAQGQCNIGCGELVGGKPNDFSAWNKITFLTKATDAPDYDVDALSTYVTTGVAFQPGNYSYGVGVEGPQPLHTKFREINYIAERGRSEKLLVDFGENCQSFTGATITLSRFYALEDDNKGEAGCWKAFDANFNQVGGGTFFADQPSGNGLFKLDIRTGAPFRFLEFSARPYINSLFKTFKNNSDYLLQSVIPTCTKPVTCDDILGGTNDFSDWEQVAVSIRSSNAELFKLGTPSSFSKDGSGVSGSSGLGVPDDEDSEINYNPFTETSEAVRIDLGKKISYAQFTVARLFNGEQGFWKAYAVSGCDLIEVGSGSFEGEEDSQGILKSRGVSGQRTVTVTTTSDFDIVEFTSGPTQSTKDGEGEEVVGSGYVLHRFVACPECTGAFQVVSYEPGLNKDGSTLDEAFSNPNNALAPPNNTNSFNPVDFVSLGFDGSITLQFAFPFLNGVGDDLRIVETSSTEGEESNCEVEPEKADVFVSQDGEAYFFIGTVCQDGNLDLGQLSWARYVKIVDASHKGNFYDPKANGFDLDGITCLNGIIINPVPDDFGTNCSAKFVKTYAPGTKKNGTPIVKSRTNPSNALGEPDSFDQFTKFVSLGFGDGREKGVNATSGYLDLEFNNPVFDKPYANEIVVVETSFGNPKFREYPEQAEVYVSKDGINWVYLGKTNAANPDIDCNLTLDTEFDFSGKINWAKFVKLVDITDPNARKRRSNDCKINLNQHAFNNGGDGFDVDAVVCVQYYEGYDAKRKDKENKAKLSSGKGIEIDVVNLYPNPVVDYISLDFSESAEFVLPEENKIIYSIYNTFGKLIQQGETEISGDFDAELEVTNLPQGIYILKMQAGTSQKSVKFVK